MIRFVFASLFSVLIALPSFAFELQGFEVEAGTELPLQVGARVKFQLPSSIHIRAGLGFIPEFYADSYGSFAGGAGIHGENTGEALGKAMASSFVIDLRAAYSVDPDGGLYAEAGYMFFGGGGGTVGGDVAEGALDDDFVGIDVADDVEISGNFHSISFHVGYLFLLTERLSLNADIGLVKPILADMTVTAPTATLSQEQALSNELQPYLEDAVVAEMVIPTASVFLSYLF